MLMLLPGNARAHWFVNKLHVCGCHKNALCFNRRFRSQAQQRNDFVLKQKAVLRDYMGKQQALLSQKREVKRLSDLIMLELRVSRAILVWLPHSLISVTWLLPVYTTKYILVCIYIFLNDPRISTNLVFEATYCSNYGM